MEIIVPENAAAFLERMQPELEAHEAANSLMYGLTLRIINDPGWAKIPPLYWIAVQEDDKGGAVRAAALITPPHNLVLFSSPDESPPEAYEAIATNIWERGIALPGLFGPVAATRAFIQAWQALSGQQARLLMHQRLFELRQVIAPTWPQGQMRKARESDIPLLSDWFLEFHYDSDPTGSPPPDAQQLRELTADRVEKGIFFVWEDGQPVCMAGINRPTPHGWTIGPVHTPRPLRCRGYATALTAALSQYVLDAGKQFVTLDTDLANPTSNSIYQKVGFKPVIDLDMLEFYTPA